MTRLMTIVSTLPTVSIAMLAVKARARFIGGGNSRGLVLARGGPTPCHRTAVLATDGLEVRRGGAPSTNDNDTPVDGSATSCSPHLAHGDQPGCRRQERR